MAMPPYNNDLSVEFARTVTNMTVPTQTPPTCAWVLSTNEVTIPCIPGERHSACTILMGSMMYEVVAPTLLSRLRLSGGPVPVIVWGAAYLESPE